MSRGGIVISRRHIDRTSFFFFFYGVVFFCRPFVLSGQAAELSCHTRLPVCLWIMDPHSRGPKKNTHLGNEVLPQDTTHRIQRPCYQRGSPCQDPAANRTTRRPPDHRKETQTAVIWLCLPFIRSGPNHLARHSERGKKTRQTISGNGHAWSLPSPRGQWRTGKSGGNWLWNHLWCPNDPGG